MTKILGGGVEKMEKMVGNKRKTSLLASQSFYLQRINRNHQCFTTPYLTPEQNRMSLLKLEEAAAAGCNDKVEALVADVGGGVKLNQAYIQAALHGHSTTMQFLREAGANAHMQAMEKAGSSGRLKIVQDMVMIGATNYDETMVAAAGAVGRGNLMKCFGVVQLMIRLGATRFDEGMAAAAGVGNMRIVRLMIIKGARDYDAALVQAAGGGFTQVIRLMLKKGATAYTAALEKAEVHRAEMMLDMGEDYMKAMEYDDADDEEPIALIAKWGKKGKKEVEF